MPRNYTPQSGIYIIVHIKSGKVYLGKTNNIRRRWTHHRSDLNNDQHTNIHLQRAWNKYGETAFKFQVLEYCTVELLSEREKHHIAIYKSRGIAYNLTDGGDGPTGRIVTKETRLKLSEANKGKVASEETRRKLSESHKGKTRTEEQRSRMSASAKGKIISEETRQKMSDAKRGKKYPPRTEEHCRKMSEANKGKVISEETRRKLSEAKKGNKNRLGKTHTEETRRKISESKKGKNPPDDLT